MPAGKSHHRTPSLDGRVTCETLIQSDHGRNSADSVTKQKEAPLHVRTNSSERLLRKLPSIIGLPRVQSLETGTYSFRQSSRRRPARFFPGNSRRGGRVVLPETEPTSPKVSCMGVVYNSKSRPSRKKQTGNSDGDGGGGGGWWKKWMEICCRGNKAVDVAKTEVSEELVANARLAAAEVAKLAHFEGVAPPSLGEMKRFSSYRKSGSLERSLDFDPEFEPVQHRRFETDQDISDMPSRLNRRNPAAEEELDRSEGVARPSLREMERFGSFGKSVSWDCSFDFEDDIEPVQQRMRFEMDLHVSDKASSSQRRKSAAALPYI